MKYIEFITTDDKRIYVNPEQVKCIEENGDHAFIRFEYGNYYVVKSDVDTVAALLQGGVDNDM